MNLSDTRIEHLREYLDSRLSWQQYIPWTRTYDAFQRYQELQENQKKSRVLLEHLNRAFINLRYTIRQSALAIVKSEVSRSESQYITDVETLEQSRRTLLELLYEIEDQLDRSQKSRKLIYYEPDRTRIFNKLHAANLALNNFSSQLSKLHLDDSLITPKLIKQLYFNEKKGFRWRFSDKYVFSVLCEHQIELKNFIEKIDLLLQSESHKMNLYANQVTPLGFLLKYSPTTTTPQTSPPTIARDKTESLPPLTPDPKKKPSSRNTPLAREAHKKNKLEQKPKREQPLKLESKEIVKPEQAPKLEKNLESGQAPKLKQKEILKPKQAPALEKKNKPEPPPKLESSEPEESILKLDLEEIDLSKDI